MDIQRKNVGRNKAIRWTIIGIVTVGVVLGSSSGSRPETAAPPAEMSALWPDTVKRGPWCEKCVVGHAGPGRHNADHGQYGPRIERILIKPGTPVKADSLVM